MKISLITFKSDYLVKESDVKKLGNDGAETLDKLGAQAKFSYTNDTYEAKDGIVFKIRDQYDDTFEQTMNEIGIIPIKLDKKA